MVIHFNELLPLFLEKEKIAASQIWQQQLTLTEGKKIQIVAPSGSGKTSLIHFLYGLRTDYEGTLLLNNQAVNTMSAEALATVRASQMSIVFQDLRLFSTHTAEQNITIKRQLLPYHPQPQINTMAQALGIGNKLLQTAGTCSFGEQQRIAIIRALQQPFSIIVLDEPFSHLDDANSQKAMQLIEEQAAIRGASILLADLQPIPFFKADTTIFL